MKWGKEMLYRYETHCHSAQCSACAHSFSQDLVRAYWEAGYAGLVLTDHFIFGNTCVDRTLPWDARMKAYYQAYLDAKAAAEELDFDVIFGIEHAYGDGKEVLIYGVGLAFLLDNPDIPVLTLDGIVERVHQYGGIVIQAHPYRNRSYVNMSVEPRFDIVDGVEIHNAGNQPGEDKTALRAVEGKGFIFTSGGDIHAVWNDRLGQSGIVLPYRVRDEKEFVAALKRRDHGFLIRGNIFMEVHEEDLP